MGEVGRKLGCARGIHHQPQVFDKNINGRGDIIKRLGHHALAAVPEHPGRGRTAHQNLQGGLQWEAILLGHGKRLTSGSNVDATEQLVDHFHLAALACLLTQIKQF